jgi:Ala-tRNA(Pro) deacylase
MTTETFLQIKKILDDSGVEYTHLTHDYVKTSDDAAKIRETNIEDAAKAIILKVQNKDEDNDRTFRFIQVVVPANNRIDLKKLKMILSSGNVALASPDEVLTHTGCTVGSVPPLAKTLFNMETYMDKSILDKGLIIFSAGTHHDSIQMKAKDYYAIVEPILVEIKKGY